MMLRHLLWILLPLVCFAKAEDWKAESVEEALFLRRIADFWEEGEYQIAKNQMEEFLQTFPGSSFADLLYAALGDLFLREKNNSIALKYYASIQSPELAESVFLNRMQCLYHLEWYATLADECEEALQKEDLDPDQKLQTTYFLAIALYQQCLNAAQEPETLLKLAQRAQPYFANLFESNLSTEVAVGFAHLCCILKDYEKASKIYLDLAKQDPSQEEEMLFQAALIQAQYDKALASQSFQELSQKGGKKAKEAVYNRLVLNFEANRFEDLLAEKEELLQAIPEDRIAMARFFLGKSLLSLKKYEEAILELQAYLTEAEPSDTFYAALFALFEAAYQIEDLAAFDATFAQFQEHFREDAELPKVLFSRAQLLKNLGQIEEARTGIEKLLTQFPNFSQKAQALFEYTHLSYAAKSWQSCCEQARLFLSTYPEHELSPFVWRYLASATAELAGENPEMREELASILSQLLKKKEIFAPSEILDWEFLLAKIHFDRKSYQEAMEALQPLIEIEEPFAQKPNALLLLALCYRDGAKDLTSFCSWAEKALAQNPNLIELGPLHASLFNAYLQKECFKEAADHLFAAFEAKVEIQKENLLWLVDTYFPQIEDDPLIAERTALLLEYLNDSPCKLAKVYSVLGKTEEQIALLEQIEEKEARLLLAEAYAAKGEKERAISLFDEILAASANVRSKTAASASLQSARLHIEKLIRENCPDSAWVPILSQLKDLVLQKAFQNEPLHLEAAIEYVELQDKLSSSPQKRLALWTKAKKDFEKDDDLLSKDYHEARPHFPQIDSIYRDYLAFMEAQSFFAAAETDQKKELQAKGKDLLLQIIDRNVHPMLIARAKKRLEQVETKE